MRPADVNDSDIFSDQDAFNKIKNIGFISQNKILKIIL